MRKYEIRGYTQTPGQPQSRFTTVVHALDRATAIRLTTGQYEGPTQKVKITSTKDLGKSDMQSN